MLHKIADAQKVSYAENVSIWCDDVIMKFVKYLTYCGLVTPLASQAMVNIGS